MDGRPKGVLTTSCVTITRTTLRIVFQARKRYFASPAPFSSISFPARGAGTKLQPSAAVAIWRGRAAKCMSSAACGGTKNMELARTSPRSAGDGAVYRIAPPVHTKHAAEGRFQCRKTEMKTRTVRCEKILPSLPAEGRGTRVSRILRGATQVQRAAPSLCPR